MSTLNERIKNRRKELGLTQKELADILSISDKTISRWESGNQMPDAILLPDLAQALNITINDLYGFPENNTTKQQISIEKVIETIPQEKKWFTIFYRISMLLALLITICGTIFLDLYWKYYYDIVENIGCILIAIGSILLLSSELVYYLTYRKAENYLPKYQITHIRFGGFIWCLMSIIMLTIVPICSPYLVSYTYEFLALIVVALFLWIMIEHKKGLKNCGVPVLDKLTSISKFIIAYCIVTVILIFIVFDLFGLQYDPKILAFENYMNDPLLADRVEAKLQCWGFLLMSLPINIVLIINYLELLIKSKKLSRLHKV